jgi:hypothetical protein
MWIGGFLARHYPLVLYLVLCSSSPACRVQLMKSIVLPLAQGVRADSPGVEAGPAAQGVIAGREPASGGTMDSSSGKPVSPHRNQNAALNQKIPTNSMTQTKSPPHPQAWWSNDAEPPVPVARSLRRRWIYLGYGGPHPR